MPGTRKLGRDSAHRLAMLRGLVTFFFENGKIETTAKHGAAAERDELAWHESAASPCPGSAARAAKTGGRRTAQFAEHAKQQRSDDGDAFARRAAFGKREPRR